MLFSMKKIIVLLLCLAFVTMPAFAADSQGVKEIKQIVADYQALNNKFSTGIAYPEFKAAHTDIANKAKQFLEANPGSFTVELNNINAVYNDINRLWQEKIDNILIVVPSQTAKELQEKYPGIESAVSKGLLGGWNPDSTILVLNYLAKEQIEQLAARVQAAYAALEPTYGFKYADGLIGNTIFVSIVDPNSSAYQAGLRFGDRITKVNGIPVKDVETFTSMLAGPEGSRLKLQVKTDDSAERVIEVIKTILPQ